MLFKVDFEKAYDSVDWGYLDDVMGRMSFPTLWRKWIRECVCTATASVLVNGSPTDEFPLRRGLRQGDPLSPFLFLLAAEGLNVLMEAMVARNLFTGYSVGGQESIVVSHLQFADDTLLMGVKSWANVRALRAVLVLFETMSGLKVNFHKSMLVGVNIPDSWLDEAASVLCCKVGKIPFLYLGLQIGGDPRRLVFWEPVLSRIKNRLSGWKSRFLSFGGRLVLLKSVLTSLPVYALSFFKAPSVGKPFVCERFGRLFALAETKSHSVAEMFALGWGADGGAWVWRRSLRAWEEEMLGECQSLRLDISLQDQTLDRWQWRPDPDTGYTVGGVYQILTHQTSVTVHDAENLLWHPQVPLKVSIFVWRLLRDRLPTRANLAIRGVLSSTADTCVFGCGVAESAYHLFSSCSIAGSLWDLVCAWVGIPPVAFTTLRDHFVQFTVSAGVSRARRSFLQLLWLVYVWVIWTERNHCLFKGSTDTPHLLLDKIKLFSFRWLKSTSITLVSNYHSWWSSPLLCLGLV
ncbi:unnamed protein product [Trifolium pratense]|uniref:Uncharacterized protein n=1 Tax=Trifolium pratense TaxID=57577 RepID=A0ACB0KXB6_TRIPR|nr:unnamed protein product [Trifolium pratense]